MKRIVRVIARLNAGGPARHVVLLCDGLRQAGFESVLVYGALAPDEGSLEDLAQGRAFRSERVPELGRAVRPLDDWRAFRRLLRIFRRERPDVVHTHTSKAGTLGRLAALVYNATTGRERPCLIVHTFHGHVFDGYFGPWATRAVRLAERALARGSDAVVALSPSQAQDLVARHHIVSASRVRVIPLGLMLDHLYPVRRDAACRAGFGLSASDVVFGFMGRLVPVKAVDMLLAAFALAHAAEPTVRLLVVGDGELRPALERQARSLGISGAVHFAGWRYDLPSVYAAMDAVVLSSINEGTPVAIIEAGAAGLPAIATAVGGVPDLLTSGVNGLLVQPGEVHALAAALLQMARAPDLRRRMGDAARREMALRYGHARLVGEMAALYESLFMRRDQGSSATPASVGC